MNVEKSFIDLSDVIRCIGNGTRPYVEDERVYKANHIIFCTNERVYKANHII